MAANFWYSDITNYIEDNFGRIVDWIDQNYPYTICAEYEICGKETDYGNLLRVDNDGYCENSIFVEGRYCSKCNLVRLDADRLYRRTEDIRNEVCKEMLSLDFTVSNEDVLSYIALVIFHELAHAYQHQILNREMRKDDRCLEDEADCLAIDWYQHYSDMEGRDINVTGYIVKKYNITRIR